MFEIKLVQNSIVPKKLIKKKEKRDQDKKKPTETQNTESIIDYLPCLFYNLGLREYEPVIVFFLWIICMGILFFVKPCQTL